MTDLNSNLRDSLLSKLDEYHRIVNTSICLCKGRDAYSDDHSKEIQSLREPFLHTLTILEGNREKYSFCLETALERSVHQSPSTCGTLYNSIDYAKLRSEIVTLALLLEEKDIENSFKEQIGVFDKAMEKAGFEVRDLEADKLHKKQKK